MSVLYCVAVCCSALQCVAVCRSEVQLQLIFGPLYPCLLHREIGRERFAACCSALQRVAVHCSVLQCIALCCSVLQLKLIFGPLYPRLVNREISDWCVKSFEVGVFCKAIRDRERGCVFVCVCV